MPVNREFLEAIKGVGPLQPLVANALGATNPADLVAGGSLPITGFFVRVTETLARAFIVTPGAFAQVEVAKTGASMIVSLPLSNVRQLEESVLNDVHSLTIELNAGKQTVLRSHRVSAFDPEAEIAVDRISHTVYVITAEDANESRALREFATAFRGVLVATPAF